MHIVIAMDSFKGCISSMDAGNIIGQAILREYPDDCVNILPLADGGEGTVDALCEGLGGEIVSTSVIGPLKEDVISRYGYISTSRTAIIEMADASGLPLVPDDRRNPMNTTTYGLGQLILEAAHKGARNFIIGLGGSATNDCGLGMLTALGIIFYQSNGMQSGITGKDVANITSFDASNLDPIIKECSFQIACDVTNPLCGANGCSVIYGPQKGANNHDIKIMDEAICRFANLVEKKLNYPGYMNFPGAGAAGGMGFAFKAFLNGKLVPGVELVLSSLPFQKILKNADILITGEGCIDGQTSMGKAPIGVAQMAKKVNPRCRTIALCGAAKENAYHVNQNGIDAYFSILNKPMTTEQAMLSSVAKNNFTQTVRQICHLIHF